MVLLPISWEKGVKGSRSRRLMLKGVKDPRGLGFKQTVSKYLNPFPLESSNPEV